MYPKFIFYFRIISLVKVSTNSYGLWFGHYLIRIHFFTQEF